MVNKPSTEGCSQEPCDFSRGRFSVKNKKGEEHLTDCRYFSKLTDAFKDIAEKTVKDTLSDSDMSLKEAVETIDSIYSEFDKKMDEVWDSITHVDKRMY